VGQGDLRAEEDLYGSPSVLQPNIFNQRRHHLIINKSIVATTTVAHALLIFNRALLLAKYHARSRPNLNQRNYTQLSGAAQERFDQATIPPADQRHRDGSHATTPNRHRSGTSSYDDALSNRMWRRRRGIGATGRGHRVSRMESGSRPFSDWLFRPLRPAITRSTG
jgi:hypothetical protein